MTCTETASLVLFLVTVAHAPSLKIPLLPPLPSCLYKINNFQLSPPWETTPLMWPLDSSTRGGHIRGGLLYSLTSDWASSLSWWGNLRSTPPVWMSIDSPRMLLAITEHSMCQPGRPCYIRWNTVVILMGYAFKISKKGFSTFFLKENLED